MANEIAEAALPLAARLAVSLCPVPDRTLKLPAVTPKAVDRPASP
jgi:hypothetical protein